MTYQETLDWMFLKLPMYQKIGASAHTKDLTNTWAFSNYLNNPEKEFKSIHIAGTNGKGSTSHLLASIFQEAGYKVGLYTSPHLKDFRERIKINSEEIPESFVTQFVEQHQNFIEQQKLSFFELTVGMAFDYFAKEQVDIAIIEVGLGGRLDSTNIITPELSIITNISLDHTNLLGNTLAEIATEKAGIIKANIPVVIGEKNPETEPVFRQKASEMQAEIIFAEEKLPVHSYQSALQGIYQYQNMRTVVVACEVLQKKWKITQENITNGLQNVLKNTHLQGRWQILQEKPLIVCDTGHNEAGIQQVTQQIAQTPKKNLHLVLGFVNDKEVEKILKYFPEDAFYYFCEPNLERKMSIDILKTKTHKKNQHFFSSVAEAFSEAKNIANEEDMIFIGGSTFVVAEIL